MIGKVLDLIATLLAIVIIYAIVSVGIGAFEKVVARDYYERAVRVVE